MWQWILLFVFALLGCKPVKELPQSEEHYAPAASFQLMSPRVITEAVLFKEKTEVDLRMDFPQTEIRYTLDGKPVDEQSPLYQQTLTIQQSTILQARAYHSDCRPSEIITQPFYKVNKVFDQAKLTLRPPADARYAADGVASLTDLQKGSAQFRGDPRWLGFQKDTVTLQIDFEEKKELESIIVSTLVNEIAWIFLPGRIEVWEGEELLAFVEKENLEAPSRTGLHFITIAFQKRNVQSMTLKILSDPLPEGHNGYGYTSWFFMDELFVIEE